MKEKYVEERFPLWQVFGVSANGHKVYISNGIEGVAVVNKGQANGLIEEHNKAVAMLVKVSQAFDAVESEAFKRCWYE